MENLIIEEWRQHPVYKNYEASNLGNIRSLNYNKTKRSKVLKQTESPYGYLYFNPYKDGKLKHYLSHRFVWECFNGLIPDGMEIDHINTIRTDNSLSNLRVVCRFDNANNPITCSHKSESLRNNPKKSKVVLQYTLEGELIGEHQSTREIERKYGWKSCNISQCCNGKLKTAYGFKWSYAV